VTSPRTFIESDDPVSREAAVTLLSHKEEDQYTDYKQTFHPSKDKSWLDLTIDVSAFANTYGGYLVFGVEDRSKKIVGLTKAVSAVFDDSNNLLQKLNRYLEPKLTELRCKTYNFDGKIIGMVFVPQSHGRTHVVSKDASFVHPSGKAQLRLRKGTFYVRRSGGVHLADARDLDDIVERRIDQFRDALLDKVAKVVQAPTTSDV
jgi:predicted HTH transcriptional regulator